MEEMLEEHLHSDKNQDQRKTSLEVPELVDDPGKQEVERTQSEYCADVRCVDDEWIPRHGEDCGNGVRRKNNVRRVDDDEDYEERSREFSFGTGLWIRLRNEEAVLMIFLCNRNHLS